VGYGVDRNETADGSGAAVTPVAAEIVDAKGDLIAGTANNAVDNLAVGANETRLVADSTQATGLKYVADTTNYAVAAKGDLLVGTAADTVAPVTVGANDTVLAAASGQATGVAWTDPNTLVSAASDTVAGKIEIATQAEQETGSDTTRAVTPGRQQFHPSAAKGWVKGDTAGSAAASYNVTSLTDNGVGNWTINWATDFSSANYAAVGTVIGDPAGNTASTFVAQIGNTNFAAGTTQFHSLRVSDGAGTDPNNWACAVFGDQ
jgi:hypothetical protein